MRSRVSSSQFPKAASRNSNITIIIESNFLAVSSEVAGSSSTSNCNSSVSGTSSNLISTCGRGKKRKRGKGGRERRRGERKTVRTYVYLDEMVHRCGDECINEGGGIVGDEE